MCAMTKNNSFMSTMPTAAMYAGADFSARNYVICQGTAIAVSFLVLIASLLIAVINVVGELLFFPSAALY